MARRVRFVVSLGFGLLLSACGPMTAAPPTTPAPTPNTLDLSRWTVTTVGTGPTASQANSGVDLLIPATASQDPQQHYTAVKLTAKCKLTGDFDLQLDYSLMSWPPRNSVRVGLVAGSGSVQRASNARTVADNLYATDFGGVETYAETQDTTGRLRLTRVGTTTTGYFRSNGSWTKITSETAPIDSVAYGIDAWTDYNTVVKSDVSVNVKNFTIVPSPTNCA